MYLTKRKPSFTHDAFTRRWRKHGALGMSLPFWPLQKLYVQAESIHGASIPGVSEDYDGIAYVVTQDEAFTAAQTEEDKRGAQAMLADELETFAGPIPPVMIYLKEEILKKGEPGGVAAFLFFNDAAKARPVAVHFQRSAIANRVVLNNRRDDIEIPPFKSVLPYRATVEVSAHGLGTLKGILGTAPDAPWRRADLAVVTREAVLWDRIS